MTSMSPRASEPLQWSPCYGTLENVGLLLLLLLFLTTVLNSQGMKKIMLCNTKKYENQAGINLTPPPPPSQNSHAVRWHCTAESERRVAEIILIIIIIIF